MNFRKLIFKEIRHRYVGFIAGVVAIFLSLFSYLMAIALDADLKISTNKELESMKLNLDEKISSLEDGIRKSMKGLGFNIFIFPKDQNLSDVYETGFGLKTMPESYVEKLANSKIVTINHLLPRLTEMIEWKERERSVLLIGVRGQVPIKFRGPNVKKPLIDPVPPNKIVLGYELHKSYGLKVGDKILFLGNEFTVSKTHKRRGTVDDISIWMDLKTVQIILNKENRINSILALECNCESIDRLGEIREEIHAILPDTQIIEKESKALARAEARNLAKQTGVLQINDFRKSRASLITNQNLLSGSFVILISVLSVFWILHLTFTNVNQRSSEFAVLAALGFSTKILLILILARSAIMALTGGILAVLIFLITSQIYFDPFVLEQLTKNSSTWLITFCIPIIIAIFSSWIPALKAVMKDPVEVLRNE